MFRQRRPLLRTAVVGGSAYAAGRRAAQRQSAPGQSAPVQSAPVQSAPGNAEQAQLEDEQNERIAGPEQQGGQPPQPKPPGGSDLSVLDQLSRLTALYRQGALSEPEFTAAKAKILGT
jgi:hypothetical protein